MCEMASGSRTMKSISDDIGKLPSCCKYTSKGILCSANPMLEEGLELGGPGFAASFSRDKLMFRSGDAGSASDGGFGGRGDNSLVRTDRSVNSPPLAVQRYAMPPHTESVEPPSSVNYTGHSPMKSGRGRGKEYAINKGSGRGQYRGRGREKPVNTDWGTGKAILGPTVTEISENNAAHGVDAHGNAVLSRFSHGFASESICSGKSPSRALLEGQEGESHLVIAGSGKRGLDCNAIANGDGEWSLPQNIICRGGGMYQTVRYEHFSDVSDQDQSHSEIAAFPPVGNIHFPCRDRCDEPLAREQNVESSNLPTGRPTGETRSVSAQAEGKGPERKMLGDGHDFTGNRGRGRGRGRNTAGRGASTSEREVNHMNSLGRTLVKILRHEAYKLGLNIRSDGYVPVKDLLKMNLKTTGGDPLYVYSIEDVKEAVRKDNKQRFGLAEENGELLIRANRGHSLQAIDSEKLLERITSAEHIAVCVHGTYRELLDSICKTGLNRMKRRHIHFARGLPKDGGVISGMRGNCDILIYLDVEKALKDEMKIYLAENGVILTEGFEGIVPPKYFANIERWPSRQPIDFQGK